MRTPPTAEITTLLLAWNAGDDKALSRLTPLVLQELQRLAHRYMADEREGHTLETTALVNEAYLKLVDVQKIQWQNRAHFFALSAQLMRRILVDFARRRNYLKRGGGQVRVTLHEGLEVPSSQTPELTAIDDALIALEQVDSRKARVVELRFFAGMTKEETAEVLNISIDTVLRDWKFAKVWLQREIKRRGDLLSH